MTAEKFLTVPEIADELRVSKMTVYRLVNDRELPSVRIGRSVRVRRADLDHYIANAVQ